ncbi:PIN domain-containing protein [Streptomyces sp. NBC_00648]|uniref:PIN domain-containing protein n=1 Tax=Streptomyces sp. NBC_00648 TaxID=2975797 RepID=UPI00324D4486
MIITDSCVLRGISLSDSSADLLRTIRALGVERVGAPWMVVEELIAQKAVEYRQRHEAAARALKSLKKATPWNSDGVPLGPSEEDRVREHWRAQYANVVEEVPTSETALREGVWREANSLPPCKATEGTKSLKVGGRDAAIWLSAIEYAHRHQTETVYFVSANIKDFGAGSSYPPPMDRDVDGLGDRFVHLTSLDQVLARFTQQTKTDDALVAEILNAPAVLKAMKREAKKRLGEDGAFVCTTSVGELEQEVAVTSAFGWLAAKATVHSIEKVQTYRIGEHEWCTGVVRWHIGGMAFVAAEEPTLGAAGCSWTTSVLFTSDVENPRLTVLRHNLPRPLTREEFAALGMAKSPPVSAMPLFELINSLGIPADSARGLPRAYEGALVRNAAKIRRSAIGKQVAALLDAAEADDPDE